MARSNRRPVAPKFTPGQPVTLIFNRGTETEGRWAATIVENADAEVAPLVDYWLIETEQGGRFIFTGAAIEPREPAPVMHLRIRGRLYSARTFAELSAAYCAERDASGEGASTFGYGIIRDAEDDGSSIAFVSYNGKVWADQLGLTAGELLFDPYAAEREREAEAARAELAAGSIAGECREIETRPLAIEARA